MRLKIYIHGEQIDTFPDQSLQLTREIYTKENVASIDIAYTQQMSVPASEINQRLFDYVHLVDYWEKPSPHLPIEAVVSLEDGDDLKAILELRGFTFERGVIKTYQIAIYLNATELFAYFGNDNLADVDFSALNFTLNQENVIASWEVGGPDYFCPVIAHSKPFVYLSDTPASPVPGDMAHEETGVEIADCKPAYLLTEIVEKIFEHYQVAVSWDTKIAAHLAELFVLPSKSAGGLGFEVETANFFFSGGRKTNRDFPIIMQWEIIDIETELSDVGDHYYDQKYHVTQSGGYSLKIYINQRYPANIDIGYRVNGGAWQYGIYTGGEATAHLYTQAAAGDYIEFGVRGFYFSPPPLQNYLDSADIEVKLSESFQYECEVIASLQMPEMKVTEFIKGFLAAFKLTLLQTGKKTYKIYDTRSIYADGTVRDWSKYVDQKVMAYQKRDSFRKLVLSHAKGEDIYNSYFEAYAARRYGAVNMDTGLVLGAPEITLETIFTVFPPVWQGKQLSGLPAVEDGITNILLHQQVNSDGEPVLSKFLLFYRNGSDGCDSYWLQNGVDENGATFSEMTTFGYYSCVQSLPCEVDTPAVTFGMENPSSGVVSEKVLVYEFWRDTLEIFINNAAYQLPSIPFRVPASEMAAFKINDTILINGIYHIPIKAIYDYTNDLIKLDLLIFHPTYAVTLPVIAGSGEFTNPLDVNVEVMHTLNGRRIGDRIFKPQTKMLWKPVNIQ